MYDCTRQLYFLLIYVFLCGGYWALPLSSRQALDLLGTIQHACIHY